MQASDLTLQDKSKYFETLIGKVSELYYSNHENQTLLKIFIQQIIFSTISTAHPTVTDFLYNTMKKIWRFFSICRLPQLSLECDSSTDACRYDFSRNPRNRLCGYINVLNPWAPNDDHREYEATIRVHHMLNLKLNYTTIALPIGHETTAQLTAHILVFPLNLMPWETIDKHTFADVHKKSPNSEFYFIYGSMKPFYEIVAFNTVYYMFWRAMKSMRMQLVVEYTVVNLQVCVIYKEDLLTYKNVQKHVAKIYTYNYLQHELQ